MRASGEMTRTTWLMDCLQTHHQPCNCELRKTLHELLISVTIMLFSNPPRRSWEFRSVYKRSPRARVSRIPPSSYPHLIVAPTYEATLALASFARRAARGRSRGDITGAENSATVFVGG